MTWGGVTRDTYRTFTVTYSLTHTLRPAGPRVITPCPELLNARLESVRPRSKIRHKLDDVGIREALNEVISNVSLEPTAGEPG